MARILPTPFNCIRFIAIAIFKNQQNIIYISKKLALEQATNLLEPHFNSNSMQPNECLLLVGCFDFAPDETPPVSGALSAVYAHIAGNPNAVEAAFVEFFERDPVLVAPIIGACMEVLAETYIKPKHKIKIMKGIKKLALDHRANRVDGRANAVQQKVQAMLDTIGNGAMLGLNSSTMPENITPLDILQHLHDRIGQYININRQTEPQQQAAPPTETPLDQQF